MADHSPEDRSVHQSVTPTPWLVGAFDVISVRELDVLAQVGDQHGPVRIALLDDETVTELYGRPPLTRFEERLALTSHLRGVDEVRRFVPSSASCEQRYVIADEPTPNGEGFIAVTPRRVSAAGSLTAATASVIGHGTAA